MYGQAVVGHAGGIPITTKPGGSCAYCGTYIVHMFNVRSADGKVFHVGSDCIEKVAAEHKTVGNNLLLLQVKSAIAQRNKDQLAFRAKEAREFYATAEVQAWVVTRPFPMAWGDSKGLTLKDHLDFIMDKAGGAKIVKEMNAVRKEMGA